MMNKKKISIAICLLFTFVVNAQTNFFIGLGTVKTNLTETQSKGNFSPVLTTGIQKNRISLSVDLRFYNNNNLDIPRAVAGVNDFFQMSTFQINTMLGYAFLTKNRFQMSAYAGHTFAKRSLNTIYTYELNSEQEVIALQAKDVTSSQNGAVVQLHASFRLYKGLSLLGFTDFTVFKGKIDNVKTSNKSDALGLGLGLRYKI